MNLFARLRRRLRRPNVLWQRNEMSQSASQLELERLLAQSSSTVDLGCGVNPVKGAVAAIDLFTDSRHRGPGKLPVIQPKDLEARGIQFVNQSIDNPLPFSDGGFEFAHCSHVIEHVEAPGRACDEMMRIATTGLLRCPSAMIEFMCGRPYHRWLVIHRGSRVVFVEKAEGEYGIFGDFAAVSGSTVNPFEAMLDWEGERPATPNRGILGRLKRRLQGLFFGRKPQTEVNLFWSGGFFWTEIRRNGAQIQGGRPGLVWWFDEAGLRRECGSA